MTIPFRSRAVVWIFAWCATALTFAQQPADTSRIAGVVVDAAGQGVPRAIVMLTGSPLPTGRAAVTDERGRFAFERLPAGRYSLTSAKPAYLKATYGALRPGGTGTTITLAAGQALDDVRLAMPHGGAIAGTIRNLKGEPIPGLPVSVIRADAPVSDVPARPDSVNTDGRGAYRLFGLAPGTYVVATQTSSAGLGEVGVMSTADVDAAMARLRSRTGAPAAPAATAASPSSIVRPMHTFTTSPVFFPGVTSVRDAQTITLGLGEERLGVDFVYQLARAAAVGGTVSGAGAQAVQLTLSPDGATLGLPPAFGAGPMLQRRSGGDGTFVFTNVTPGKYTLTARTSQPQPARGAPAPTAAGQSPTLFAMTSVEISGDDITGLTLNLSPALHVSGHVDFRGAGTTPPDVTKIRIRLTSPSSAGSMAMARAGLSGPPPQLGATIGGDGTFDIGGVVPDSYRIETQGDAGAWRPLSALLNGRDLFDVPLDVMSGDVGGIEIVFSDRHSQISGRLLQANGGVATGYFIVAFPVDESLRLRASRRLKSVRPSTDGQFHFDDLPAGDYYLAALTDADSDEWQSATVLTRAAAAAVKIAIADDSRLTQDLRIGGR